MMTTEYRAYDILTEWMGPVRADQRQAERDAAAHNYGCRRQGGYGRAIVVQRDPEALGRCIDLSGAPVWPPYGQTGGSVRWTD